MYLRWMYLYDGNLLVSKQHQQDVFYHFLGRLYPHHLLEWIARRSHNNHCLFFISFVFFFLHSLRNLYGSIDFYKNHIWNCVGDWRGERKIKCIEQIKSKRSLPKAQKENKRVMNVCRFPGRPNQHRAEEQQSAVGIRMRRRQITIYFEIYFKTVNLHLFSCPQQLNRTPCPSLGRSLCYH